jgi:hypothetical protein
VVVVLAEIKSADYEAIDKLLGSAYASIQQFIEVAVRNQLALEEGLHGSAPVTARAHSPAHQPAEREAAAAREVSGWAAPLAGTEPAAPIPASADDDWRSWVTAADANEIPTAAKASVPDRPLWGQINRVLPIAAGVRVLAHIGNEAAQPFVGTAEWHAKAADAAQALRIHLEAIDTAREHRHGQRWATAFPDDERSSRKRYMNQFLGYLRPNGEPEGGAAVLGLVAFANGDPTKVALTKSGAVWASLPNPVFDSPDGHAETTFSREEAEHYLDHVRRTVPAEYQLMRAVAELVDAGKARTEIDEQLGESYPDWARYIGTVRAGALGRLQDLGLLRRERRGLQVDYGLTDLAYELRLTDAKGD